MQRLAAKFGNHAAMPSRFVVRLVDKTSLKLLVS